MVEVNDQLIREMVQQVLQHVQTGWGGRVAPTPGQDAPAPISTAQAATATATAPAPSAPTAAPPAAPAATDNRFGQFTDVNEAVEAAKTAQRTLSHRSLAQRKIACDAIRKVCLERAQELGNMEYEETQIGHPPHKPEKMLLAGQVTQGVEALHTECFSGDHGITLEEHAPWGVIGAITPVTHSLPTLTFNAINIIAAGNSLVCNPHPAGKSRELRAGRRARQTGRARFRAYRRYPFADRGPSDVHGQRNGHRPVRQERPVIGR